MASDTKFKKDQLRSYLNRDFDSFRASLLQYARTFFSDQISDFSEASVGGLLLDMNAYALDVMSYYLDHQFNELDIATAVEDKNIERLLRSAGVPIRGASPAVANVDFYIKVPTSTNDTSLPVHNYLPVIREGTVVQSSTGTSFTLTDNIDFAETYPDGTYLFQQITPSNEGSSPRNYILKRTGICVSGGTFIESFPISREFVPFRKISLSRPNITEIIYVNDSDGNEYHEVSSLVQNTVFKRVTNTGYDADEVLDNLEIIPAPYRYVSSNSRITEKTTITFGSGRADTLDDDIIPDPSELSLPLYGKKTFSRFSIDPNNLLMTQTLGISPVNTTVRVKYRAGGGISHNTSPGGINAISTLLTTFKGSVPGGIVTSIRSSADVKNPRSASGGENAPSLEQLKRLIVSARNSQSRIVTREDLLAHVYMMPSRFGRVFRAGIRSNSNNPLSTQLFIVSRGSSGILKPSSDALKDNLALFLNQNRLISDAIDILDSPVVNIGVKYSVVVNMTSNKNTVIQIINSKIKKYFGGLNFQIDQPIFLSEIQNVIINSNGVVSLAEFEIINLTGVVGGLVYSSVSHDTEVATFKGILSPPPGGIFEMRYPTDDIIGVGE